MHGDLLAIHILMVEKEPCRGTLRRCILTRLPGSMPAIEAIGRRLLTRHRLARLPN
jgi:hypothetical protein